MATSGRRRRPTWSPRRRRRRRQDAEHGGGDLLTGAPSLGPLGESGLAFGVSPLRTGPVAGVGRHVYLLIGSRPSRGPAACGNRASLGREPTGRVKGQVTNWTRRRSIGSSGAPEGFPAPVFGTNCYVLAPGAGEECLVVDPGIEVVDQLARRRCASTGCARRRAAHPRPPRPHLLGDAGLRRARGRGVHPRRRPYRLVDPLAEFDAGLRRHARAAVRPGGDLGRAGRRGRARPTASGCRSPAWTSACGTHPGTPRARCCSTCPSVPGRGAADAGRASTHAERRRALRRAASAATTWPAATPRRCARTLRDVVLPLPRRRRWSCPATARRPPWPASGRRTPTCSTWGSSR